MMPHGYPFTMSLWVLCERGSVEFSFRAGGQQVDSRESAGTSLMVYEDGKAPCALPSPGGDGYDNQAAYFAQCVSTGSAPAKGAAEQGRLAVATALAARKSIETGRPVTL